MNQKTTHIIGAGLAGLSAATTLAEKGRHVVIYEATGQAGGRCRSYFDAGFGSVIDNGNHLLLSGNNEALSYLKRVGSENAFSGIKTPVFDFVDAKTKERWCLRMGHGLLPLWLLSSRRRVPNTNLCDYFSVLRLLLASRHESVTSVLNDRTILYKRLWQPLLLSALNTHPNQASAALAAAILRGTLLKGGKACVPLVANGLSSTFIEPALRYLSSRGATVSFNRRLREIQFKNGEVVALDFVLGESVAIASSDSIICAIPPWNLSPLLPGIVVPDECRAILNAHFRIAPPPYFPTILGVINATTEWIFSFPDRMSVTISDADRFMQNDREAIAIRIWQEVQGVTGLTEQLPPWQIVKERRATFAATPDQDARRPGTRTSWRNLFLAGDYVQTGLPATIEGAVTSGVRASEAVIGTP